MTIYVKNMVCNRCVMAVKQVAEDLALDVSSVAMGELVLSQQPSNEQSELLKERLSGLGFEILENQKKQIIEKIKTIIIEQIQGGEMDKKHNLSSLLSSQLNRDYSYLSGLFSDVEGTTIEKYYIGQKIEKVKELIIYDELSLSEIAWKLGYSSVAHLSGQFKQVTGLTPTHFKQVGHNKRKPLDKI